MIFVTPVITILKWPWTLGILGLLMVEQINILQAYAIQFKETTNKS